MRARSMTSKVSESEAVGGKARMGGDCGFGGLGARRRASLHVPPTALELAAIGLGEAFEQLLRRRVVMEVVAAHAAPDHGSTVGSHLEIERGS